MLLEELKYDTSYHIDKGQEVYSEEQVIGNIK